MRTPSGILHVVDSQTDQIIGAIQPKDYWNDNRHWEIKNNVDKLDFTVFDGTKESATLTQQNLVLKEVRDGRIVPYTITETEKNSSDRSLTTYASGEWILLGKANYIDPQKFEGKTVAEFVDIALLGTKWKKGNIPYESFRSMTIDEFIDPLSFLKKIASLFGLEIQYRIEVVGNKIERFVDMVKKRGQDTGKIIELGKDLIGIKRIENSQNICTALIGFVKGEGDNIITIEKINNGLPYITDSDAFQRWNEKGQHKFGFYTPETEEQNMSPERLKTLMEIEMKKRVFASVSYEVEAASIGRIFGLAHELINEGDTIRIKDTGFTPKLYLEARAIAGDESYKNPMQDKYVYGNYREIVDPNEELRKIYNRILSSLGSKQEMLDQLDKLVKENGKTIETIREESKAAKELAEKVQENLKNNTVNIIEAANPPTDNLKVGKTLWRDISNGKPGVLKVWNGTGWELLIPDVESVKKETLDQVNKDIAATKKELNKKVEDAQNETSGQFKEVKENLQEVSLTIKNVQNSQGEINKTVSEMKQTNEGFTKSIELLTKKDGEITEKLNTVVETSEGTKKIISEVQQTTNDLKKTTTEITEKAGKISEKLESVEKKVANDKAGGRNLLLDSNVKYEKTDYLINQYTLSENFSAGEEYTFVIKGSVPQGQKFGIWQNGGSNNVGYATSVYASGITYVTFKAVATTVGNEKKLSLYNAPQNTTKATVEWVALYKGNKPQDWTPAPENQVTNDDFTKKTNEIIKSVEGTTETIKKVEKTQGDFSERVNTVEKNAEGFNQSVKKLQETQTQQGKQLTEAATTIEQHTEALNLSLKMKDVEEYVGGLNYINLILNSVLKENTKNWSLHTGTIRDASVLYKGAVSFRTITTGLTEDSYRGAVQTIINNGTEWDFVYSAYFYTDNKASLDKGSMVEVICLDGNGNRLKTYQQEITLTQGIWVRSFVTGQVVAGTKSIQAKHWIRRNGRLWAAQPQFQMGIKPSSFMENPSDIVDKDKLIELIGDKVATEDYNKKIDVFERDIKATKDGIEISSKRQETFINETYAAYVKETGSKIKVLDEGILAQVIKNGIITAINMSPGKITIDAAKLEINADTMVKWLTAKGIDTNIINVNGDKITINKNGVTVKMLDFLFQDEWGTKTTAVSRRNLIADPDFSSVGKKNIGHADYYGFEGGYGLSWKSQGNVVIEKNTSVFDYEQMVNAARVDMYNYPEAVVNNGIHPGNEYTISAHFRTSMINGVRKTAKPRLHVCCVKFRDNVSYDIWNEQKMDFPEPSTFYGEIRRYSYTFKVPTNYKPQEHALIIKVCSANGQISAGAAICVSGVTLYSGKYASMYNWDRAAAERAAGLQPFNSIAVGSVNNNIGPAPDGQTFDISTEKEVKFFTNIRAVQGVNLGGNAFQGWGHIRFVDGNRGVGFYVNNANGWQFNALG
ncbi:phage tail spike protein [Bacillus mycoides]|uniref:phage tail spike protein n=1 Tax=Bacillus mycoides TaxID=1405 RepID=UPI003D658D4E